MSQLALIKIRADYKGNHLQEPEIIELIPDKYKVEEYLNKLATIYARMLHRELTSESNSDVHKSERKSC